MDALWKMPVEVPVSLLLRDRNFAWTCGQLSLDADGAVLHADDLLSQSALVCDYISEILRRGELPANAVRRALLYYVHRSNDERDLMLDVFRSRLGEHVLFDPVPLPHFYYDGVLLEVDVFCGVEDDNSYQGDGAVSIRSSGEVVWVRVETSQGDLDAGLDQLEDALGQRGLDRSSCLSEHWFAPTGATKDVGSLLEERGWSAGGFVVDAGPAVSKVSGVLVFVRSASAARTRSTETDGDTTVTVRTAGEFAWLHGTSQSEDDELVEQTRQIMAALGRQLHDLGVDFVDVAKCTAHYVAGATPEELHGNMKVRNDHYTKPGLASTGLPVFGFSDPSSKIAIDLTVYSPSVNATGKS